MTTVPNATSGTGSTTGKDSRTTLSGNFETFIKLLTTQLQYQDPLQPMDTNQFTQQLVQYSQVEQQLSTNDKLDQLVGLQKGVGIQNSLSYLGWEVKAPSSNLPLQGSRGIFNVSLESAPQTVNIGITDSTGKVVRGITLTGAQFSPDGKLAQDVVWDGKDNNGNKLPDGKYGLLVTATNASGSSIKATTSMYGTVTGVDLDADGNSILKIGDLQLSPSAVTSIRTPSVIGSGSDTTSDGST